MKKARKRIRDTEIAEEISPTEAATVRIKSTVSSLTEFVAEHKTLLIRTVLPTAYCILFGTIGFDMGIYPFGISALCAVQSGAPSLIAAAGAVLSSLFVRGGFYIAAACAAVCAALAVIRKFRKESADGTVLRAVLSMIMSSVQAVAMSISDGISFYELCGVFLSAALCPILTVSLRGLFFSDGRITPAAEAGVYVLLYTSAYSLRIISPAGESLSAVLSMFGVLYASYAFGIQKGVMTGVSFGLAADPRYSIIYAAAAAGSGVLMSISPMAATTAGVLLAMSFGIYSTGASAFGELFPEMVFCAAVAGPLLHYKVIPKSRTETSNTVKDRTEITETRLSRMKTRLRVLSDNLGTLASVMGRLSSTMNRPSVTELRQMCDEAFDESCAMCRGRGECWDKEYRSMASAVGAMAVSLKSGKTVGAGSLPEGVRTRCPHTGAILTRINMGAAMTARNAAIPDSTAVSAEDFSAMSRLVEEITDSMDKDFELVPEASQALAVRLEKIGLHSAEVSVYGDRHRRVFVRGLELGCSASGEEIRAAAESVLGGTLTMPEYRIDGREISMSLHTTESYAAELGRCSVAKRGERCGDSITSFKGDGGYFYALISDGMGSGGTAALTSGISAVFIERMLETGCSLNSATEMLNSFLARRSTECFTTVDLMEADLITGELKFLKSGAAPSFVLRNGKLFRLNSSTVPVGIVTPFDGEQIRFSAKAGDFVIMLSDGVVPDGTDCPWLYELLCGADGKPFLTKGCDLNTAAETVARTAAERSDFADDVTVGIIRIKSK